MRIFLCGQKSFGLEIFLMLRKRGDEVVGVAAPTEDQQGQPDPLYAHADALGVPVVSSSALRASDIPIETDLIVAAHSHAYIGRKTRETTKHGAIGYHPSLLPRHRGRDAIKWAIRMNDPVTGGTVFWLNDNVDGGDIAAQEWCWIRPGESASELWRDKLFPLGLALLNKTITDIEAGCIIRIKQDERVSTFEPAMDPPRLFRPELPMISNGKSAIQHEVEDNFAKAIRLYSLP